MVLSTLDDVGAAMDKPFIVDHTVTTGEISVGHALSTFVFIRHARLAAHLVNISWMAARAPGILTKFDSIQPISPNCLR